MIRYILYVCMLALVSSVYNYMEDNKYTLYNREILYNKWENIKVEPIVHTSRKFRAIKEFL
jgi:hypothetical protein